MNSIDTLLVRSDTKLRLDEGLVLPVVRSKNFPRSFMGEAGENYKYSRIKNPTRDALEKSLALAENGRFAYAYASGMAAEANLFLTLNSGDHVVMPNEIYGDTIKLFKEVLIDKGITYSQTSFDSYNSIFNSIKNSTKLLFVETPTNPLLTPIDLNLVRRVSKDRKVPFVVDMTFSPPYSTRALDYGAIAVVQSLTKYIAGHGDLLGGAIITSDTKLAEKLQIFQGAIGAVLSPDDCYRTIQGMKTLHLRWNRVSASAMNVAKFLSDSSKVSRVLYPGLPGSNGYEISKKQMKNGFGGVLSFELNKDFDRKRLKRFVEKVSENGVVTYTVSLGAPETILTHPASMSHNYLSHAEQLKIGISNRLFRLSVGFESVEDIINSLRNGLKV